MANDKKQPKTIQTVAEFIAWVGELPIDNYQGPYVYRGLHRSNFALTSSIFREIKKDESGVALPKPDAYRIKIETLLRGAKERRFHLLEGREALTDLELMADLQHNHARTMLIDFSRNPLVALWFACSEDDEGTDNKPGDDTSGLVLAINTASMGFKDVTEDVVSKKMDLSQCLSVGSKEKGERDNLYQKNAPKWNVWRSRHLTERARAQDSFFVFGWPELPDQLRAAGVTKLIDTQCKKDILKQLKLYFGIEATKLFPDRHGYARWHKVPAPSADFFIRKGVKNRHQGNFEQTIKDYDEAIALAPDSAVSYRRRGYAKNELKQYDEAIKDLDKAIELDPNYAVSYNHRGWAKRKLSQYDEAIKDHNKAIELDPNVADFYYGRALAYKALGKTEEEKADFAKAEALKKPQNKH